MMFPELTFYEVLTLNGHKNCLIGSKVAVILLNGKFFLLVELQQNLSVPTPCSSTLVYIGVFSVLSFIYSGLFDKDVCK